MEPSDAVMQQSMGTVADDVRDRMTLDGNAESPHPSSRTVLPWRTSGLTAAKTRANMRPLDQTDAHTPASLESVGTEKSKMGAASERKEVIEMLASDMALAMGEHVIP
jgi:hypothetical protein